MVSGLFAVTVALSLILAYINGFHDASNAVSTLIATRTMRERSARAFAAVLNLLGALLGLGIVSLTGTWALGTLGLGTVSAADAATTTLLPQVLIGILVTMIVWSLVTWWFGMPSSTWQALVGATAGATLVMGLPAPWMILLTTVLVPLLVAPVIGSGLGYVLARTLRGLDAREGHVGTRTLAVLQTVSAGAVAVGHGLSDSRVPMAMIVLAATWSGASMDSATAMMVPVAVVVALGTYAGGRRIIRTLSRRLTNLLSVQGFAAETATATVMAVIVPVFGTPISTSQTLTSSVVGAGLAMGRRQINWKVFAQIVATWVATPLASALGAAVLTLLIHRLA